jgi:hypothetical protein
MGTGKKEGEKARHESGGMYVGGEVGGRVEKGEMRIEIGVKGYAGNSQGVEGMFRVGYRI